MNNKKLNKYLKAQFRYTDSPASKLTRAASLNFILKNLEKDKREIFIGFLENEEFDKIPPFISQNIPDFERKLNKTIKNKLYSLIP